MAEDTPSFEITPNSENEVARNLCQEFSKGQETSQANISKTPTYLVVEKFQPESQNPSFYLIKIASSSKEEQYTIPDERGLPTTKKGTREIYEITIAQIDALNSQEIEDAINQERVSFIGKEKLDKKGTRFGYRNYREPLRRASELEEGKISSVTTEDIIPQLECVPQKPTELSQKIDQARILKIIIPQK